MLVEGLWPSYSEFLAPERERRRVFVEQFVNQPSRTSLDALSEYGVDWVVADYAVTKTRNWSEFAEIRFENAAGSVLELKRSEN